VLPLGFRLAGPLQEAALTPTHFKVTWDGDSRPEARIAAAMAMTLLSQAIDKGVGFRCVRSCDGRLWSFVDTPLHRDMWDALTGATRTGDADADATSRLSALYHRLDGGLRKTRLSAAGPCELRAERCLHALVAFWRSALGGHADAAGDRSAATADGVPVSRDEEDDAMAWAADDALSAVNYSVERVRCDTATARTLASDVLGPTRVRTFRGWYERVTDGRHSTTTWRAVDHQGVASTRSVAEMRQDIYVTLSLLVGGDVATAGDAARAHLYRSHVLRLLDIIVGNPRRLLHDRRWLAVCRRAARLLHERLANYCATVDTEVARAAFVCACLDRVGATTRRK
jgi:hypothetical protein